MRGWEGKRKERTDHVASPLPDPDGLLLLPVLDRLVADERLQQVILSDDLNRLLVLDVAASEGERLGGRADSLAHAGGHGGRLGELDVAGGRA